jgi:hypothetical protein
MATNGLFGVTLLSDAKTNGSSAIPKTASGLTAACKLFNDRNRERSKSLNSYVQDLVALNSELEICLTRMVLPSLASSAAGNC